MSDPKPHIIDKSTAISIGLFIAIGTGLFMMGTIYEKVRRLDEANISGKLITIEADLAVIKFRLGIPAARPVTAAASAPAER